MRRYYLHTRKGVYYVEFVVPETGQKLTARSTGTTDRDEAILKISEWLKTGLPSRGGRAKPLENAASLEAIVRSIKKATLTPDDAVQIVSVLRDRELVDFPVIKYGMRKTGLIKFLQSFWDYGTSPYIEEKKAHRRSIGRSYCLTSINTIQKHWIPFFGDIALGEVTLDRLNKFGIYLSNKGLLSGSINRIMKTGIIAIRWAFLKGKIPSNPCVGLENFGSDARSRGVLTPSEAEALFASQWSDERIYLANLLSCVTGMRLGEVIALRSEDIGENTINLVHSWSNVDLMKTPKNGEARVVPIFPEIRDRLLSLAVKNPHGEDGFIFFGAGKDAPVSQSTVLRGFRNACASLGNNPPGWFTDPNKAEGDGYLWEVSGKKNKNGDLLGKWSSPVKVDGGDSRLEDVLGEEGVHIEKRYRKSLSKPEDPVFIDCKARNIVFHSHRHYYAARMTDRMTAEQVSRITGHKSLAVFEKYSDHIISENLDHAREVGTGVFGNILAAARKGA
jgi:integrase